MPRFAANLSMLFQDLPFLDRFAAAQAAGFGAVEFLFPYDHPADTVAGRLKAAGLQQALFNLPPGDWAGGERGLAALPGREAEFRESVDTALAYARALGCRKLHAMAGVTPGGAAEADCRALYIENLRATAARLAAEDILLLIEPLNQRDMPGYFLKTTGQAREIIAEVGAPNLKLQFDVYHTQISEGDLAVRLRDLFGLIGHIQIAGVPERHEPSVGEINYPYLFALMDQLGYDGWVGCEYRPAGGTVEGLGWAHSYGIGA
ncbi:MAG: hydroxypyruvate isomerase family protein [Rhodospirillaceae bacterium]|nr:hydroxypyruvate isomerase family protein [Rhodospirillaceae bacterium]